MYSINIFFLFSILENIEKRITEWFNINGFSIEKNPGY